MQCPQGVRFADMCVWRGLRDRVAAVSVDASVRVSGRLRACPRYPIDKSNDRRPVEFSVDPEDDGGEEYNYFDYYVYSGYGTGTTT